jgi:hypothetical protein
MDFATICQVVRDFMTHPIIFWWLWQTLQISIPEALDYDSTYLVYLKDCKFKAGYLQARAIRNASEPAWDCVRFADLHNYNMSFLDTLSKESQVNYGEKDEYTLGINCFIDKCVYEFHSKLKLVNNEVELLAN